MKRSQQTETPTPKKRRIHDLLTQQQQTSLHKIAEIEQQTLQQHLDTALALLPEPATQEDFIQGISYLAQLIMAVPSAISDDALKTAFARAQLPKTLLDNYQKVIPQAILNEQVYESYTLSWLLIYVMSYYRVIDVDWLNAQANYINFNAYPTVGIQKNKTLLFTLVIYKQWDIVKQLIEQKQVLDWNVAAAEGKHAGATPLFILCINKRWDIVNRLIEQKATLDWNAAVTAEGPHKGEIPLFNLCINQQWDIIEQLIEQKVPLNWNTVIAQGVRAGMTPLLLLCIHKQWDIVKKLIEQQAVMNWNAAVTAQGPHKGRTPLLCLCLSQQWDIIKQLIEQKVLLDWDAEIAEGMGAGTTPFSTLCDFHRWDIIKQLINQKAVLNWNADNKAGALNKGQTPFFCLCNNEQWEIIDSLLQTYRGELRLTRMLSPDRLDKLLQLIRKRPGITLYIQDLQGDRLEQLKSINQDNQALAIIQTQAEQRLQQYLNQESSLDATASDYTNLTAALGLAQQAEQQGHPQISQLLTDIKLALIRAACAEELQPDKLLALYREQYKAEQPAIKIEACFELASYFLSIAEGDKQSSCIYNALAFCFIACKEPSITLQKQEGFRQLFMHLAAQELLQQDKYQGIVTHIPLDTLDTFIHWLQFNEQVALTAARINFGDQLDFGTMLEGCQQHYDVYKKLAELQNKYTQLAQRNAQLEQELARLRPQNKPTSGSSAQFFSSQPPRQARSEPLQFIDMTRQFNKFPR